MKTKCGGRRLWEGGGGCLGEAMSKKGKSKSQKKFKTSEKKE